MPEFSELTDYQTARNALIATAEREATSKLGPGSKKFGTRPGANGEPFNFCLWTEFFHEAMDRMAKEAKLVK